MTTKIRTTAKSVIVETAWGCPSIQKIKDIGGTWSKDVKGFVLPLEKLQEAQKIVSECQEPKESVDDITIIGLCEYKGKPYGIRWNGRCRNGEHKAHLVSFDGELCFWVPSEKITVTRGFERGKLTEKRPLESGK